MPGGAANNVVGNLKTEFHSTSSKCALAGAAQWSTESADLNIVSAAAGIGGVRCCADAPAGKISLRNLSRKS